MEALNIIRLFLLLTLRWFPRIISVIIAVFIFAFSFDIFGQHTGFWKTLGAFLIQNIPTILTLLFLVLSWKWSWTGGVFYTVAGILYCLMLYERSRSLFIVFLLFATGFLYMLDWLLRDKIRNAEEAYWQDI